MADTMVGVAAEPIADCANFLSEPEGCFGTPHAGYALQGATELRTHITSRVNRQCASQMSGAMRTQKSPGI
jgi:hypothetical protein